MTEFDDVVVGGGTAGCIVAARLAEDPAVSVGLIEWIPNRRSRHSSTGVPVPSARSGLLPPGSPRVLG